MPFYEYECSACKFYVEVLQKISDPQMKKCPSCKKPTLKKLVSAPAFRLKGGGWYETDFKSDQDKKRNLVDGPEKESSKETESSSDTKDAKKADKPDAKPAETAKPAQDKTPAKSSRSSAAKKPAPKSKAKPPAKKK